MCKTAVICHATVWLSFCLQHPQTRHQSGSRCSTDSSDVDSPAIQQSSQPCLQRCFCHRGCLPQISKLGRVLHKGLLDLAILSPGVISKPEPTQARKLRSTISLLQSGAIRCTCTALGRYLHTVHWDLLSHLAVLQSCNACVTHRLSLSS